MTKSTIDNLYVCGENFCLKIRIYGLSCIKFDDYLNSYIRNLKCHSLFKTGFFCTKKTFELLCMCCELAMVIFSQKHVLSGGIYDFRFTNVWCPKCRCFSKTILKVVHCFISCCLKIICPFHRIFTDFFYGFEL